MELYQEVFCAIFDSLGSFKGGASLHTWAYRVAINTCLRHVRRERHEKLMDLDADIEMQGREDNIEAKVDFKIMLEYASSFKAIDRELIYLYLIGESQNEMASILGISESNVSTRISRLKNNMASHLNRGA